MIQLVGWLLAGISSGIRLAAKFPARWAQFFRPGLWDLARSLTAKENKLERAGAQAQSFGLFWAKARKNEVFPE
jgi:hypothetical protein